MPTLKITQKTNNHYLAEGDLTLSALDQKTINSFTFLQSTSAVCIDLIKITHADSGGLALLIEWIKHSKRHQTRLSLINIPPQLLTLAKLGGFEFNNDYPSV